MSEGTRLLLFDTTHHALWAEEVAGRHQVPVEVVPAPADARAGCDLALELPSIDVVRLRAQLEALGVPHRLHVRSGSAG